MGKHSEILGDRMFTGTIVTLVVLALGVISTIGVGVVLGVAVLVRFVLDKRAAASPAEQATTSPTARSNGHPATGSLWRDVARGRA